MDYEKLGFMCGIEIHNRLNTEEKLFCSCEPKILEEGPTDSIRRRLRPVAGEMGGLDPAVVHELRKGKQFVYDVYDNTCLVELDEEPPHEIDSEALNTALTISIMTDAQIPQEVHTMRKIVIDGSNTSGFQRTAIVGRDGKIETSKGDVNIDNISVEEESAGIVERGETFTRYRLDRLGIPLIEIGTDPSIKDPEHAQEVAEKLGTLIRSTRKSQRGIGSIRQDVNVSIKDGARVEVKGLQELGMIGETIENEVQRQINLLEIKRKLKERKAKVSEIKDVTDEFKDTDNKILKESIRDFGKVYALVLRGFSGLMKKDLHEGKYFAKELVGYTKVHGVPGFFHTDEDVSKYKLEDEFEKLEKKFKVKKNGVIVVLGGRKEAAEELKERAEIAIKGIPEETRGANPDGSTDYLRPLPGAFRMYPETDVPPVEIKKSKIRELKDNLPETWEELKERLTKEGLSEDLADQIVRSEYLELYETLSDRYNKNLVASTLTSTIKELSREGLDISKLDDGIFNSLFKAVEKGKTAKESVSKILEHVIKEESSVEESIEELGLGSLDKKELKKIVKKVIKNNKEFAKKGNIGPLMGDVMKEARGKADGALVNKILKEEVEKVKE